MEPDSNLDISVVKAATVTRLSLSGFRIKSLIWRWQLYCVLKSNNVIELYSKKRSYALGRAPKTIIDLSDSICICPAEYIRPTAFLLLTKSCHICLSSSSNSERDEWIEQLNTNAKLALSSVDAEANASAKSETVSEKPRTSLYIRVWPVTYLPSTVNCTLQLRARYWLAANDKAICVLPYTSSDVPLLYVMSSTIRCVGGRDQSVYFEMGRQANTGEGHLSLQAISAFAAVDIRRFFQEFMSKRNEFVSNDKFAKASNRLKQRAENRANNKSILNESSCGNEVLDPLPETETSVSHSNLPPQHSLEIEDKSSYLEITPPKQQLISDAKHAFGDTRKEDAPITTKTSPTQISTSEKEDFAELNFGGEPVISVDSQPVLVSLNNTSQHSHEHSYTKYDSVDAFSAKKTATTVSEQLLIEKASVSGDYVAVCPPKSKKQQQQQQQRPAQIVIEPVVTASSSTLDADEDVPPFLMQEFSGDPSVLAKSSNSNSSSQVALTNSRSGQSNNHQSTVTVVKIPSDLSNSQAPVQYVSLQVNSENNNSVTESGEKASLRKDSAVSNSSDNSSTAQTANQVPTTGITYAELDFTSCGD